MAQDPPTIEVPSFEHEGDLIRRVRVRSVHSGRWVYGTVLLLLLLSLGTWLDSQGADIYMRTNVPGAFLNLDGRKTGNDNSGVRFADVPFGTRVLSISAVDYFPRTETIHN